MKQVTLYSPLSFTSAQFADALFSHLGRGRRQALDLYKQLVRQGTIESAPSSFHNAPKLFQEMRSLIDLTFDQVVQRCIDEESKTEKFLIQTRDGHLIESVVLSMKQKKTLCISSQIGCQRGCAFCQTGKMGLIRNLQAKEIVGQVFQARFYLNHDIQNVVFMGMGEPLDNQEEVLQAFSILSDVHGMHFGQKNITLSTSGHIPGIHELTYFPGPIPNLAVSLNAANDELRARLMPINREYGLERLKEAISLFIRERKKEVLLAYVLLDGVNDSSKHAEELIRFTEGLMVKINLIPYNSPSSSCPWHAPLLEKEEQFASFLRRAGLRVLLRRTKGDKIMAACGQLGSRKPRRLP